MADDFNEFNEIEAEHKRLCDIHSTESSTDIKQRAEIDQFILRLRLAGQRISDSQQRNKLRSFLIYWGSHLLTHDGMIYPPLHLLPVGDQPPEQFSERTDLKPSDPVPLVLSNPLTELQIFGTDIAATNWLENTRLVNNVYDELKRLETFQQYNAKLLRVLHAFSTTMHEPTLRSELVSNSYSVKEIYYARQAVLVIRKQVWDKRRELSVEYKRKLRDTMQNAFNNTELDTLCFDLFGKADAVEGINTKARIQNLINHFERQSDIAIYELIAHCYWERPDRDWDYSL
jgi:Effector-associated domain 7